MIQRLQDNWSRIRPTPSGVPSGPEDGLNLFRFSSRKPLNSHIRLRNCRADPPLVTVIILHVRTILAYSERWNLSEQVSPPERTPEPSGETGCIVWINLVVISASGHVASYLLQVGVTDFSTFIFFSFTHLSRNVRPSLTLVLRQHQRLPALKVSSSSSWPM